MDRHVVHAEKLFTKYLDNESVLNVEDINQLCITIRKLLKTAMRNENLPYKFKFKEIGSIISNTASKGNIVFEKAQEAFENLMKYFILVYLMPCKKEFKQLKTFCGFYQSKIRAHLCGAELLFYLVGYKKTEPGILVLVGEPNLPLFRAVAFECVAAAVECELLSERPMKETGSTAVDAIRWHNTGEIPVPRNIIETDSMPTCAYGSPPNALPTARGLSVVGNKKVVSTFLPQTAPARAEFPYIDDEEHVDEALYIEGTIDDHVMASMARISKRVPNEVQEEEPRQRNSQEWDFVRTGLENKFGAKYFDGARGDIMNLPITPQVRDDDNSDEGIDLDELPPRVNYNPRLPTKDLSRSDMRTSGYHTMSSKPTFPASSSNQANLVTQNRPVVRSRGPNQNVAITNLNRKGEEGLRPAAAEPVYRPEMYSSTATGELVTDGDGMKDSAGMWSCSACTLDNNANSTVCAGCGKSRIAGSEVEGPKCGESMSVCQQCTFENQTGALECAVCNYQLEKRNVHTYV